MSIVRWDPMREMEDLFDRYTRAVDRPRGGGHDIVAGGDWSPRVDIAETETAFVITAEIPDVPRDAVKVTVDNGVLTIRGERKQEKEEKGKKFHKVERFFGSFVRSFSLPDNVDAGKIEANFKGGMLNLNIPKTEPSKPRQIEVKVK